MMRFSERPPRLASGSAAYNGLFATTVSSRRTASVFKARPRISSLCAEEYISAVSKKLIPHSTALRMIGRLSASLKVQSAMPPKPMPPRQRREPCAPVEPIRVYFKGGRFSRRLPHPTPRQGPPPPPPAPPPH